MQANIEEIISGRIERRVILTVHQQQVMRIFDEGKNSNGGMIGTYSPAYIKRRAKKGHSSNPMVVLEFTGQMRNDYSLFFKKDGGAFSAFKNQANFDKMEFNETRYGDIFDLTETEADLLDELFTDEVNKILAA